MSSPDRSRATAFGSVQESLRDESGAFPIEPGRMSETILPPLGELGDQVAPMALDAIEELPAASVSLIPEPPRSVRAKSTRPPERAKLVIEDLSLWPDNPYLASSLVPPPAKPFAYRKAALIVGAMLLAAGVGGITQWAMMTREARNEPVARAAVVKKVAAPRAATTRIAPREPTLVAGPTAASVVEQASAPVIEKPAAVVNKAVEPVLEKAAPVAVTAASAKITKVEPLASALPAPPEPTASAPDAAVVVTVPVAQAPAALEAVATTVELPEAPTRDQVTAGFESVRAAVVECAAGQHGVATIQASIVSTGRVAQALVEGAFQGTAAGSCIARAVRAAKFPAFSQARLSVSYPFAL